MTKEEFNRADDLMHDIKTLETIKETQNNRHWVGIICAENQSEILRAYSDDLMNDFETFISAELDKLKMEFEKL